MIQKSSITFSNLIHPGLVYLQFIDSQDWPSDNRHFIPQMHDKFHPIKPSNSSIPLDLSILSSNKNTMWIGRQMSRLDISSSASLTWLDGNSHPRISIPDSSNACFECVGYIPREGETIDVCKRLSSIDAWWCWLLHSLGQMDLPSIVEFRIVAEIPMIFSPVRITFHFCNFY